MPKTPLSAGHHKRIPHRRPSVTYCGLPWKDAKGLERRDEKTFGLAKAEASLTDWHVQAVQSFLKAQPADVDVIGFRGQTVIHRPEFRHTVQLGDGSALAKRLAVPVVYLSVPPMWPLVGRATLVPVYHRALAASVPERPVAFVNIGGVSISPGLVRKAT